MKAKVVLAAAALVFAAAQMAVSDDLARGPVERFTLADQIVWTARGASGEVRLARDRVAVAADAHVADSEDVGILFLMPGAAYRQFPSVHPKGVENVALAGTEFVLFGRMGWPLLTDKLYVLLVGVQE